MNRFPRVLLGVAVAAAVSACALTPPTQVQPPQARAAQPQQESIALRSADQSYGSPTALKDGDVPPAAKPGECYARVVLPAQFADREESVLLKAASHRIEVVPAQFQDVDERVLVRPATKRLEVIPARYEAYKERVLVRPASKRLEQVPVEFETVTEQVVDSPARMVWKRSASALPGAVATQVDAASGDVLCLVEEPATYRTVSRQVVKRPAATREVEIPAEYAEVEKTRLAQPETTRDIETPAEYRSVKTQRLAAPAREVRTPIPAEYQTVKRRVQISEGRAEWRSILCQNNSTPAKMAEIQNALRRSGFDPGRNDGMFSTQTMTAVNAFQRARNLPVDPDRYINVQTVRALGVNPI